MLKVRLLEPQVFRHFVVCSKLVSLYLKMETGGRLL